MKYSVSPFYILVAVLSLGSFQALAADDDGGQGEELYQENCVACHGEDGKGAFEGMPDFTDPDGRLSKDDKVLIKHITEGFESEGALMAMPEKGGNEDLTDKNIKSLLSYIRSHFGQDKTDVVDPDEK